MRKKNASLKSLLILIIVLVSLSTVTSIVWAVYFNKNLKERETDLYLIQAETARKRWRWQKNTARILC